MVPHQSISSEEDIPDLCKSIFFTKEKLISFAWAVVFLFITGYGAAVAYALTNSVSVTRLEAAILENRNDIDNINAEINKKLDILINKSKTGD